MTLSVSSPITGGAQTGFTAPTYTVTQDTAPAPNGKQWAVTALGGTQAGVVSHSVSLPFTISLWRPLLLKLLPKANPITGVIKNIPVNVFKAIIRKGVIPALNQTPEIATVNIAVNIPAGAETYDIANVRGMLSAAVGTLNQISAGLGDTVNTGIS